jgi:hypothetical protein
VFASLIVKHESNVQVGSSEFDQAQRRGSPLRFLIASLQLRALYAELWNELCEVQWHPKQLASAVEKYRDPSEKRAPR